jgi:hypothetical protein
VFAAAVMRPMPEGRDVSARSTRHAKKRAGRSSRPFGIPCKFKTRL